MTTRLKEAALAARWQISKRTLQRWRQNETGPAYLRLGGRVAYCIEDVLEFESASRVLAATTVADDQGQE